MFKPRASLRTESVDLAYSVIFANPYDEIRMTTLEFSRCARSSVGAIVPAILAGLLAAALFVVFNYLSLGVDEDRIAKALSEDFASNSSDFLNGGSTFDDCLLLAMTIDRPADRLSAAISPNRIYGSHGRRGQDICGGLQSLATERALDPNRHVSMPYHQYWSGMRSLLALSLPAIGIDGVRNGLQILWVAAFSLALFGAFSFTRHSRKKYRAVDPYQVHAIAILACLLLFFQVGENSKSFPNAPTDVLFFLLIYRYLYARANSFQQTFSPFVFGIIGALVGYFEMLHGAIPLFIAGIVFLELTMSRSPESISSAICRSAPPTLAFAVGVLTVLISKIALVSVMIDSGYLMSFIDALLFRISGDARQLVDPIMAERFDDFSVSLIGVAKEFYRNAGLIAFGSQKIGVMAIVFAVVTQAAGGLYLFRIADPTRKLLIFACLASSAVIYVWWLVFLQHSMEHTHFMLRLWAWPIALACIIFFNVIIDNVKNPPVVVR
jgi:hypothetical protein